MHFKSLRARTTALVTIAFAVWMSVVCVGLMEYAEYLARHQVDQLLKSTASTYLNDLREAQDVGTSTANKTYTKRRLFFADFIQEHREDLISNDLALLVVDGKDQILLRSQTRIPIWPQPRHGDGWRIVTVPAGQQMLVLGYEWKKTEKTLREQAMLLFALSLCVVIAVGFVSWVLVGRTLSPISRLSRQAVEASTDTLHLRLASPSDDIEMVELVFTLNDLLSRLAGTAVAKGRFYAAASHELRTPLQALSGHLEVALTRERTAEEYRNTLEEARNQTRRLISLAQDLLLLNQLDATSSPPVRESVAVADITERVLHSFQPLIEQRNLQVLADNIVDNEIIAPPMHVEMLVRNVIENAVNYATPGGTIRIWLHPTDHGLRLAVFNSFAAALKLNAEELFEPFYRQEVARSVHNAGNGLGLAICKAITIINGWTIDFRQDDDGVQVTAVFSPDI